ncbi:MAG: hypothetical protein M8364_14520 [Methylobacter sp.]|uniref:hypothetical protein n=1 Tax=Methylobacter sp. TaxID=2051955 RepID=UPI00258798D8|nr:hypothetical protein [Methylobacter sp.]MCL7422110.1 hypothetical protein [Methylobacter sp.]
MMMKLGKYLLFKYLFPDLYPAITSKVLNIMNIIKKTALTFIVAIFLGTSSVTVFAEEAATEEVTTEEATSSSAASINETIAHVEKALEAVNASDFAAAHLHLKSARASSDNIVGDDAVVKKANGSVIQGQIQSKRGDVKKAADELNKALELYKSLL